jgi:hypothetical protein
MTETTTKKKRRLVPELDLPPMISTALRDYLGRRLAKLSSAQLADISAIGNAVGEGVGRVLRGEPSGIGVARLKLRLEGLETSSERTD